MGERKHETKKMNLFVQTIIMTAYSELEDIVKVLEGACDFTVKTFGNKDIKDLVNESFSRMNRWKKLRKDWMGHKRRTQENE